MGTFVVVKVDIIFNPEIELQTIVSRVKIDVFLFDGFPETLDPDVVLCPSLTIHAYIIILPQIQTAG